MSEELEKLRKQIEKIDAELVRLINERTEVAQSIGEVKRKKGLGVVQKDRETEVLSFVKNQTRIVSPQNIENIWGEIIAASRSVQHSNKKIGYLGPEGTFTQQAAKKYFTLSDSEFIPLFNKKEVFSKVAGGYVDFGVVPVENSQEGSVAETLDRLIEFDVKIYGELELRIVHNLIGIEKIEYSKIRTIYSHPQALAQTSLWITKHCPNAELIEVSSTAKASQKVKDSGDPTSVAIGNELAAEFYGLSILDKGIENNTRNYTRFLIISKNPQKVKGNDKTSIVFVAKHEPGSLFAILKIFAEDKINLTKIESRPAKNGLWEYIFICDYDGHFETTQPTLEKVRQGSVWLKVLGSYPKGNKYE